MIESVFQALMAKKGASDITKSEATELFINLLVGDQQIRRLIGGLEPLDRAEIKARSNRACRLILKILR